MKRTVSDRDFSELVAELRGLCPAAEGTKVIVRRVPAKDLDGDCGDTKKKRNVFTIRISRGLTRTETVDTLVHEWAHVLTWRPYHPLINDHGPEWGVYFAMAYRAMHRCT